MTENRALPEMEYHYCPHLGLQDDAGTAVAYPSVLNCCYQCKPVIPVYLSHQSSFCLTQEHNQCEVFARDPGAPLPSMLRAEVRKVQRRSWLVGAVSLLGLALFLLAIWQLSPGGILNPSGSLFQQEATRTFYQISSATVATVEGTAMVVDHTATLQPTMTPTKRVIGGLETLLGYQNTFLIHRVRDGESLELLARLYGTAVNSMTAVNYGLPTPLPVGWYLVVPVNRVSVAGIPPLEAYLVTKNIQVDELAVELSVSSADLQKYNNLDGNVMLVLGEWILVPHP